MEKPMLVLPDIDEPSGLNAFPVLYWNHAGLQMNRITHSLGGPQGGPTMSSRALGLLHLAMHDAFFGVLNDTANPSMWLDAANRPPLPAGLAVDLTTANAALTGAAITILERLYGAPGNISDEASRTLRAALRDLKSPFGVAIKTESLAHRYGVAVAEKVHAALAVLPDEPGADQGNYKPEGGRYHFDDEPLNPVRLMDIDPNNPSKGKKAQRVYHGPFYGTTVEPFAVTDPNGHRIAAWPEPPNPAYESALREVHRVGGAATLKTTMRTADQTAAAYYWAYDGANLIGTPPRLYNQILRKIAWSRSNPAHTELARSKEFVRLFALANVAMADAGKFAWAEKYRHDLWRPLSGIRQHDASAFETDGGSAQVVPPADPFWLALGAPETNTNKLSFKPPFPAYPSGHATFGSACFQMARLYYASIGTATVDKNGPDDITFSFVSEEMNGVSRDLHQPHDPSSPIEDQPGLVRTYVKRKFPSLWHAIWENAFSRIWLGVHWRFDAFDYADVAKGPDAEGDDAYKNPAEVSYSHVWTAKRGDNDQLPVGGVPLGLGIANDIFADGMRQQGGAMPAARSVPLQSKISNTTCK
jgi:vanadium chloroperoxidase